MRIALPLLILVGGCVDPADVGPDAIRTHTLGRWGVSFDASACGGDPEQVESLTVAQVDGELQAIAWRRPIEAQQITDGEDGAVIVQVAATNPLEQVALVLTDDGETATAQARWFVEGCDTGVVDAVVVERLR